MEGPPEAGREGRTCFYRCGRFRANFTTRPILGSLTV